MQTPATKAMTVHLVMRRVFELRLIFLLPWEKPTVIGIAHLIGTFAFQARHNPYRPDNRHIFTLPINF